MAGNKMNYSTYPFKFMALLAGVMFLLFDSMACTRTASNHVKLSVSIPSQISSSSSANKVSALAVTKKLTYVAVNARVSQTSVDPARVWIFNENKLPAVYDSSNFNLVIEDNIPITSNLFIQFLGVYEDQTTGLMTFNYGATTVDSTVSGDINANITPKIFAGSSSKEGHVAGRYLTDTNKGPSGTVVMYFRPDVDSTFVGHPSMAVDKSDMFAGWFNLFTLDTTGANAAKFDYILYMTSGTTVTKTNLFPAATGGVNLSYIEGLDTGISTDVAKLAVVNRPSAFGVDGQVGFETTRVAAQADYVFGFFSNNYTTAGGASANWTTDRLNVGLCYSNATSDALGSVSTYVNGLFLSSTTFNSTTALKYKGASGTAGTDLMLTQTVSASAESFTSMLPSSYGTCGGLTVSTVDEHKTHMRLHHWGLEGGGGDSTFAGFSGPFAVYASTAADSSTAPTQLAHDSYLNVSSSSSIAFNWTYLPGVYEANLPLVNSAVTGVLLMQKKCPATGCDGGSNHDDDLSCNDRLALEGFTLLDDVAINGTKSIASSTVSCADVAGGAGVTGDGYTCTYTYNPAAMPTTGDSYVYALCPYKTQSTGRKYFKSSVNEYYSFP